MATITTRSGKGSPLTNNEVDANFNNLNTDKAELSGATFTGDVTSTGFSGDITGAVLFQAKAGEGLTKGDPVYISGISGNQTVVSKADANDANKMPCFGIVDATVSNNANCSVVTFGTLSSLDTSSFSEGDELYISDTGTLSTTAPTGEASQLQKIAKVTRSHASAGSIKVMSAGRTNATPNLDDGKFFLGNSSNQSASATFSTSVTDIALPLSGGAMTGAITTNSTFDGRDVATDGTKLDGIEASADVTDTANVTAAGALMDSELTAIASVKALNQGVATGDSPDFAALNVNGTATVDGLTVDSTTGFSWLPVSTAGAKLGAIGTGSSVIFNTPSVNANYGSGLAIDGSYASDLSSVNIKAFGAKYGSYGSDLNLFTSSGTALLKRLAIASNGDISLYEDTGTTPKLFWDASAESLGIGTSSPSEKLTVAGNIQIEDTDGYLQFKDTNGATNNKVRRIYNSAQALYISRRNDDESLEANDLVIDSSGKVGIGTDAVRGTSTTIAGSNAAVTAQGVLDINTDNALGANVGASITLGGKSTTAGAISRYASIAGRKENSTSGNYAGYLQLSTTNGSGTTAEAMRIDSSGRVGIGTSSPATLAHLYADNATLTIQDSNNFTDTRIKFLNGSSSIMGQVVAPSDLAGLEFYYGTLEAMRIDSSGRVGIGTTSPIAKLHVKDNTTVIGSDASGYATLNFHSETTGSARYGSIRKNYDSPYDMRIRASNSTGGVPLIFEVSSSSEAMRISSAGRVGIGTSSPSVPLEISNTYPVIRLTDSDGTAPYAQIINSAGILQLRADDGNSTNNSSMQFWVDGSEDMRIDSLGRVGIGTASPTFTLEVNGGGAADNLKVESQSTLTNFYQTTAGGTTVFQNNNGNMAMYTGGTARMHIAADGNVGIGIGNSKEAMIQSTNSGRVASNPAYSFNGDLDTGMFNPQTDNTVAFATGGSERMRIDSAGTVQFKGGTTDNAIQIWENNSEIARIGGSSGKLNFLVGSTTASRMTIDSSGNVLVGTSNVYPADNNVAGHSLTAVGQLQSSVSGYAPFVANRKTSDGDIVILKKDGTAVGSIGTIVGRLFIGNDDVFLTFQGASDRIYPANSAGGGRDNAIDLGASGARFKDIYATNGTIQTSDRNEKQDIAELSDAEQRVAVACKGLLRKFRWKDSVAEKGDEARTHFGIIAQDLQAAFAAEGLDAGDYAMFISTTWTDEETNEEKTRMGVRYSELLAFIIAAI